MELVLEPLTALDHNAFFPHRLLPSLQDFTIIKKSLKEKLLLLMNLNDDFVARRSHASKDTIVVDHIE